MKSARVFIGVTVIILLNYCIGMASGAEKNEAETESNSTKDLAEYSNMSGNDLVQKLMDGKTISKAFYELWRRANPGKNTGYETFLENHYDPEGIVCPQGNGKEPLYLVLYGYLSKTNFYGDYETANPSELFPPPDGMDKMWPWESAAIEVFTSGGKRVEPFGGNNGLEKPGVIADINGDGLVERAYHTRYGVDGIKNVTVLEIAVVKPQPQQLLALLYNWGEEQWSYRLTDTDKDGVFDLELGPKIPGGIKTKVVYKWDKDKKIYLGPTGKDGDHFRLSDATKDWPNFEQLKKDKLAFPKDPDFVDEHMRRAPWTTRGQNEPPPEKESKLHSILNFFLPDGQKKSPSKVLSKPYRHVSLKNLTNEEIVKYMDDGKSMLDLEQEKIVKTRVPTNYWSMDPRSAALSMADENRYPDHRTRFRLAVDDRDRQKPPDICSIAFTDASDRSYNAIDRNYFLRVDPKKSYLAYTRSWAGGMVFYNFVHDQPAFDFRLCELTYEEARHVAHTIWWLNRIRSQDTASPGNSGMMGSTADGRGSLRFRDGRGNVAIKLDFTMWPDHVSERWQSDYNQEVCLNLASFLISDTLTRQLGEQWSKFEPKNSQNILARQASSPRYVPGEMKKIQSLTGTFLDLFSLDQALISFAIVRESTRAAGDFLYTDFSPKLTDIQSQLPAASAPKRTKEEIEAEIKQLDGVNINSSGWNSARKKQDALYNELMTLHHDIGADDVQVLRDAISLSLKKIRCADDPQALQDWASSKEPGFQWALQRLRGMDRKRYVASLEWWINNSKEEWARQAFAAIAQEDSARAVEIAKEIPPGKKDALTVSAFSHLAEVDGIPDEQKRVKALIQIALDPKSGWEQRSSAIKLLVPPEQPLRYPDKDIDTALMKLLSPEMADDAINFTIGHACRALAQRGRTEYFPEMVKTLGKTKDCTVYTEILGAVTQLSQCAPAKYNPRLLSVLRSQLKRSNKMVPDLLMAAWSADLRALKPELEDIATSGPDDYEDERAHAYGGEVRDIKGRFHLARKIVSLWNEEDILTRCRLLLAFGLNDAFEFVEEPDAERLARMKSEITKMAQALTPEQKKQMEIFLEWYQNEHITKEKEAVYRERRSKFVTLARNLLNLQ